MPVSMLERRSNQCAFILDEAGAEGLALMCGERSVLGRSWCSHHMRVVYVPMSARVVTLPAKVKPARTAATLAA